MHFRDHQCILCICTAVYCGLVGSSFIELDQMGNKKRIVDLLRHMHLDYTHTKVIYPSTIKIKRGYSRVRNKHSRTLINFLTFMQGLRPYSGYAYSFCKTFQGAMFIQGATFIPDSRVSVFANSQIAL